MKATPFILLLVSCHGKSDSPHESDTDTHQPTDDTSTDTDTGTLGCRVEILNIRPQPNSDAAYYREDMEFELDEADPTSVITLATDPEADGDDGKPVAIPGKQWVNEAGRLFTFRPDAPLVPRTSYRSQLEWCSGKQSIPFKTSRIGIPAKPPKLLVGSVWSIDLNKGRWVEPRAAMGGIITNFLTTSFLLTVELADDNWIEIDAARAFPNGSQDVCYASAGFSPANFTENPYFSVGPKLLTMEVANVELTIDDLEIQGSFSEDGSSLQWVEVTGIFDTRPLDEPIAGPDKPGAACAEAAAAGSHCVPCADGEPYCLLIDVDELMAEPSSQPIHGVAEDCSDPDCKSAECAKKM